MTEDRMLSSKKLEDFIENKLLETTKKHLKSHETRDGCAQQSFGYAVVAMTLQTMLDELYNGTFDA